MRLDPDDPRVTAYALGELPADEARRLESDLEASPEARAAIDETRALGALLSQGLAAETAQPADPHVAEAVRHHLAAGAPAEAAFEPKNIVSVPRARFSPGAWIAAAAACVVLASFFLPGLTKSKARATKLAALNQTAPAESVSPTSPTSPARPTATASPPPPRYADAPAPDAGAHLTGTGAKAGPAEARDPATANMSPELMRRYALAPAPNSVASSPKASALPATPTKAVRAPAGPAPVAPSSAPEPALRQRYGLAGAPADANRITTAGAAEPASGRSLALAQSEALVFRPTPPAFGDEYRREAAPDNPGYVDVGENAFRPALDQPLSTFSLDVDTGSYANIRRFLNAGQLPPRDAVRLEEMLNYFRYETARPRDDEAFGVIAEVAACPWEPSHRLVRLAIQARGLEGPRPAGNFVFLVDVSGSMTPPERLPLLKQALKALVRRLSPADRVAIVTYASSAGVHLPSTSGEQKEVLLEAIDRLQPGGSTNGEGGIRTAYDVALAQFIRGGVNRVFLCTDGDFNVGISNQNDLVRLIEDKARSGVFLTTLGVGTDNFKDALMRRLADRGNGSYHYLDSFEEAQRVLVGEMDATFVTVARDAKAQVEFNPARVGAWRLLGYEKRLMAHEDFNDDTKDAGEIGAGHLVTVLYEIVPPGGSVPAGVDPLKYQRNPEPSRPAREIVASEDLLTLKLRYQRPEGSRSTLLERAVKDDERAWTRATPDFRFAAAVASFGMILRESPHRGNATYDAVRDLGRSGLGADPDGWRAEFLALVKKARSLSGHRPVTEPAPAPVPVLR